MNIAKMSLEELTTFATEDFKKRVPIAYQSDLLDVRLSGLSLLQYEDIPYVKATTKQIEWYMKDTNKPKVYDSKELKRIIRTVPYEMCDIESSLYLKECRDAEKAEFDAYMEKNLTWYEERMTLYISEWFTSWYYFWRDAIELEPAELDWNIFFSILDEEPPYNYMVSFAEAIFKVNTLTRQRLRPEYLRQCWNDLEIREAVLHGKPFQHNNVICPYSTVFSYIHRRNDQLKKHKEATNDMRRPQNIKRQNKRNEREKLVRQILKAQREGKEIIFKEAV